MPPAGPGVPHGVSVEPLRQPAGPVRFVEDTAAIVAVEIRKLRHDPLELLTRAVQPVLWLLVFGTVMAHARAIPTGGLPYLDFLAPGILAQSSLFVAIFYGIAVIWERDLGVLNKYLVSPASRPALVLGKALSAGVRSLAQAVIVYLVAAGLGVHLRWGPLALAGVVVTVLLGAAVFATFSLIIACLVKTRERFMGIGQILTMPLFFASNAIYPVALMPPPLRWLAHLNPLTYQTDLLRALMLSAGRSAFGLPRDLAVLIGSLVLLVGLAARLCPRVVQ
ncbi:MULTISPECIES: ABC transporter permease [Micromonospora]|uniref:Transport permease protein n=1 Tax=Micromonospora solifontis TaxID=2487138 RepID=A0ABX9WIL4_9ACTN|nr:MULTISPECIES: ABC transporter permease [Micromonospora]NES13170.1 ABC transporter permease [Micromonospora sp. PPF5-17B]NES36265.1 ABC transporter permease [Micromonospora solifontis]NES55095.1 ABC transporter permease [Micromonospora sp. PPF5-6]RNL99673.1 multidrug ABC transporter permease [Micromonospora solifontis]